jgi:hypothetical protein
MTLGRNTFEPAELGDGSWEDSAAALAAARVVQRAAGVPASTEVVATSAAFVELVMAIVATEPLPQPTTAAQAALLAARPLGVLVALRDAMRVTFSRARPWSQRLQAAPLAILAVLLLLGGSAVLAAGAVQLTQQPVPTQPVPSVPAMPSPSADQPTPTTSATDSRPVALPSAEPAIGPTTAPALPTPSPEIPPTPRAAGSSPSPAAPTAPPRPAQTPAPTPVPVRTATPTPSPRNTPKPTPRPTATDSPRPSRTPHPSDSPEPTETPQATDSQEPSPSDLNLADAR